jgi:hypothetical protein
MFKIPKNTSEMIWTNHSIKKMKQYGLSEQRIKRVLNSPKRIEEGIAENTIAVMQIANPLSKNQTEIWVMIQRINSRNEEKNKEEEKEEEERKKKEKEKKKEEKNKKENNEIRNEIIKFNKLKMNRIRIISAWRYPGKSPIGKVPEIPEEVWDILEN